MQKSKPRLFHVSEKPAIKVFRPKPSPQHYSCIKGHVVFAVSEKLLHNYLLPRECPRVTYYTGEQTTEEDHVLWFGTTKAEFVVVVENAWCSRIAEAKLYCYELPNESFELLDECAGYYISYETIEPLSVTEVPNIMERLLGENIELRFTPSLHTVVKTVVASTLNFSLIRMRNAGV